MVSQNPWSQEYLVEIDFVGRFDLNHMSTFPASPTVKIGKTEYKFNGLYQF